MLLILHTLAWLICAAYSTIPGYWLLIHPRVDYWRAQRSPYRMLVLLWAVMFALVLLLTSPFRRTFLYQNSWAWVPAACLFALGIWLYKNGGANFSLKQLQGTPEISGNGAEQRLITAGIRSRVRHPIYLAHLCELLAWSMGTGMAVCYALTFLGVITGAWMIYFEDSELERRFGEPYREYRAKVPAVIPRLTRGPSGV